MKRILLSFALLLFTGFAEAQEVILFSSVNCGPCRKQEAELKKNEVLNSKIVKLSIDNVENFQFFKKLGFSSIPQIAKVKDGVLIDALSPGVHSVEEIEAFLDNERKSAIMSERRLFPLLRRKER